MLPACKIAVSAPLYCTSLFTNSFSFNNLTIKQSTFMDNSHESRRSFIHSILTYKTEIIWFILYYRLIKIQLPFIIEIISVCMPILSISFLKVASPCHSFFPATTRAILEHTSYGSIGASAYPG